jgi:glycosyltransferase involved in cell wall biosynthesis
VTLPDFPDKIKTREGSAGAAILLDLSGNERAALDWAAVALGGAQVQLLDKVALKWRSKREALARIRELAPYTFAIFTSDLEAQRTRGAMKVFAALAGARHVVVGDMRGRTSARSRWATLLIEAPRLALELVFGYLILSPASWLFTVMVEASLIFRKTVRASGAAAGSRAHRNMLYLRATVSTVPEGGMVTHVKGFAGGAASLGHRLTFLFSGRKHYTAAGSPAETTLLIEPSATISATRGLFELWNNLVFTIKSLRVVTNRGEFDVIYQRYSRFNSTGAALSFLTGRLLLLEYNGSEVWIARRWDPVGALWLLKRFEKLNLRAADLIFVVSDVERRNLIAAQVNPEKIIVNPNGVDPEEFRPDCGGRQVREALGITEKIVIGFLASFGPWHGARVLAEAACQIKGAERFHFLFIGDGDERSRAEAIIDSSEKSAAATFTGYIPHKQAPAYLDACDILASPHVRSEDGSEFFGSPTKLFEYLAMARPIVASRLGQIAEIIRDGENGRLVEPGDARELASAIEALANDGYLRKRLGDAARRTAVERFTWQHNAARVFEAIEKRL